MNSTHEQKLIEYTLRSYPRFPRNWYYPKFRLATCHPVGVLTDTFADQIIEFVEMQEHDQEELFDRYTDFSRLTQIKLKINHVFEIARRRRRAREPVNSGFFANQPVSLSIAKMYQGLMERAMITVRVFEEREAAAEWLGVPLKILYLPVKAKMKTSNLILTALALNACLAGSARSQQVNETGFVATISNNTAAPKPAPEGMVWIPGGEFTMGAATNGSGSCEMPMASNDTEPAHRVRVDSFWMDTTTVTNEQFEKFVRATGYVTIAERTPTKEEFPTAPAENLVAGSVVFAPTDHEVPLNDHLQWWTYLKGANWRHPQGPESILKGKEKYPVVQIAYPDAEAYAKWAGKRLPSEAEFEFAARGGLTGKTYTWGDEFRPNGKWMANTWQGKFSVKDAGEDGFVGLAPVAKFPPNGYGLFDMAGNVWQWCSDWYRPDYYAQLAKAGSVAINPQGPDSPFDPAEPNEKKRVHRGGSFLCNDQYCSRYIVGTRGKGEVNTGTNHLGFRCVKSISQPVAAK